MIRPNPYQLLMTGAIVLGLAGCEHTPSSPNPADAALAYDVRAHRVEYTAHPLGTLGGSFSTARDINRFGFVVGQSETSTGAGHAFITQVPGGPMQDLGLPPGYTGALATAINDSNVVVGVFFHPGGTTAFSWTSSGGFTILPTLGGNSNFAEDINNQGTIVGWSEIATFERHPFAIFPGTGIEDLGDLGGGNSWAIAVNDHDVIVGAGITASQSIAPYRWSRATGQVAIPGPFGDETTGINNGTGGDEVISGTAFAAEPSVFRLAHGWKLLDKLNPQGFAIARDVNDRKVVVGQSEDASAVTHAFVLHRPGGRAEDLTPGHPFFSIAFSINKCGLIAGDIEQTTGNEATVWVPFRQTCQAVP